MAETFKGRCLCGAVTIAVTGALGAVSYCHCTKCRRQTGLYYATTSAPLASVQIAGEADISRYRASPAAERGFCRICGSALYWKAYNETTISLMAGLFDVSSGLEGGYHIYCADKGDFYAIEDGLPQFAASQP